MKRFNIILAGIICFYLVAAVFAGVLLWKKTEGSSREYMVEVNRIMSGMEKQGRFSMPDLLDGEQIGRVSYLTAKDLEDDDRLTDFLAHRNGFEMQIELLQVDDKLLGLVRFDYKSKLSMQREFLIVEGILLFSGLVTVLLLLYIRQKMLLPFLSLSNMPYELSKGRLGTELEENRSRFFGKFVWGITMLRDNLKSSQLKSLKLEKEKKLMLLSISHDIETPLNTIKLYAKALKEGMYDTEESKSAAEHIERLTGEIEGFVKEIVRTSSEEVVHVEVENSEFYLKELAEMIRNYYSPKCRLVMTELVIGNYDNKLLKGSLDSTFEVVENLMENAFKYGDGRKITVSFYEEEYCQLIKIHNTGQSVKAEEMPHLFDSFFRGSNTGDKEGNGLGLYICREIMRKMEGEIFAQREADGMSFQLVFHI